MIRDDLNAWCSLWRASGIGSMRFQAIIEAFGSPEAFFVASDATVRKMLPGIKEAQWRSWKEAAGSGQQDIDWRAAGQNRHIVTLLDEAYPPQLRHIPDPPPLLFVYGDPQLLHAPQLAVVGSRQADRAALRNSYEFSSKLAHAGMVITSGLALGVDGAAHRGALDGGGKTVAVVATGLDRVYPARHHELAKAIVNHGVVVSEMPIGTGVRSHLFPRRNRIISGLSLGVLVVQASERSGSLITARQALEQGREVFAIPGSIHDPLARGCHSLIKSGAVLVDSIQDIVNVLQGISGQFRAVGEPDLAMKVNGSTPPERVGLIGDKEAQLLAAMSFEACHIDELDRVLELTNVEISAMLLELELDGYVERLAGGRYRRLQ